MQRVLAMLCGTLFIVSACGGQGGDAAPTLLIGGIPDQDVAILEERFNGVADHLSEELGLPVAYQPSVDYAAVVTAFANGDIPLAWFGGLTGVQARMETPGARAIAQRPIDTNFHSVFIVGEGVRADALVDLAGLTFTFGSETSTSGHLMPRHFLTEAGVDPERDFSTVGYSGSHDTTWKLVESGSFDAGALNESVWNRAVDEGQVDTDRVRVLERTPPYFDYHWVAHPAIDQRYGPGTTDRIRAALIGMNKAGEETRRVLTLFDDERFIETSNGSYDTIESVARDLGLVEG